MLNVRELATAYRLRELQKEVATVGGGTASDAVLDFGAYPGSQEATTTAADTSVSAGEVLRAWFNPEGVTSDHTVIDHRYAPLFVQLLAAVDAGVGAVIYARSEHKMQGQWAVQWGRG